MKPLSLLILLLAGCGGDGGTVDDPKGHAEAEPLWVKVFPPDMVAVSQEPTMAFFIAKDEPTDEQLSDAALSALSPLPFTCDTFPEPEPVLKEIQKWVDEKRAWVRTLTDSRIKRAYTKWLDFEQGRIDESRDENRTHIKKLEREAYSKERALPPIHGAVVQGR